MKLHDEHVQKNYKANPNDDSHGDQLAEMIFKILFVSNFLVALSISIYFGFFSKNGLAVYPIHMLTVGAMILCYSLINPIILFSCYFIGKQIGMITFSIICNISNLILLSFLFYLYHDLQQGSVFISLPLIIVMSAIPTFRSRKHLEKLESMMNILKLDSFTGVKFLACQVTLTFMKSCIFLMLFVTLLTFKSPLVFYLLISFYYSMAVFDRCFHELQLSIIRNQDCKLDDFYIPLIFKSNPSLFVTNKLRENEGLPPLRNCFNLNFQTYSYGHLLEFLVLLRYETAALVSSPILIYALCNFTSHDRIICALYILSIVFEENIFSFLYHVSKQIICSEVEGEAMMPTKNFKPFCVLNNDIEQSTIHDN